MARLPDVDLAASPDVANAFERVAASRGWVSNLMRAMAHAPEGLRQYAALGHYGRYGTDLTDIQRELVIVTTVRGVEYGWVHHSSLARQIGVTDAQLATLQQGRTPGDLQEPERALCDYVLEFTACRGIRDSTLAAVLQHFQPRQVVDIALLSAYYMAAGALIIGLEVPLEPPEAMQIELAWQKKQLAG
jgi:4-carboxymuconolactone decarboxylase